MTDSLQLALELRAVFKRFGAEQVLAGVDLAVAPGTIHFVMGTSGAGKSLLARMVVGLVSPDSGALLVAGTDTAGLCARDWSNLRTRCQLVLQQSALLDGTSVLDNVALPLRRRLRLPRREAYRQAEGALDAVGMLEHRHREPYELSSGVRKCVAIARAIVLQPSLIVYDEPTTGLEPSGARRVDELILALRETRGLTSLVVSHDLVSARGCADQVTFLHEGKVAFSGPVARFLAAPPGPVASFVAAAV